MKLWNLVEIPKFGGSCEIWWKLWNLVEIVKFGLKLWTSVNIWKHMGTYGNIWEHLGTSRKLIGTHKAICRMDWMGSLKHSHTRAPLCGANKVVVSKATNCKLWDLNRFTLWFNWFCLAIVYIQDYFKASKVRYESDLLIQMVILFPAHEQSNTQASFCVCGLQIQSDMKIV